MKRTISCLLFHLLFLLTIATGCSKENETNIPTTEPPFTDNDGTLTVNPQYVALNPDETIIEAFDIQKGNVILSFVNHIPDIKEHSVIVIEYKNFYYLRRVNNMTSENGKLYLQTEQAYLNDIFMSGKLILATNPEDVTRGTSPNICYPEEIYMQDEEGNYQPIAQTREMMKATIQLLNIDCSGQQLLGPLSLEKGVMKYDASLIFACNFSSIAEGIQLNKSRLMDLEYYVKGDFVADLLLKYRVEGSFSKQAKEIKFPKSIPNIALKFTTPTIPPVPVVITVTTDLYGDYSISGKSYFEVKAGARIDANHYIGLKYHQFQNELKPEGNSKIKFTKYMPTLQSEGELLLYATLYPRITIAPYGIVGPYIDVKPYQKVDIEGGFLTTVGGSMKDFLAMSIELNNGVRLNGGINFLPLSGSKDSNMSLGEDFMIKNILIYKHPHNLEIVEPKIAFPTSEPIEVEYLVTDSTLLSYSNAAFPVLLRFTEENGNNNFLDYTITNNGKAFYRWTPSSARARLKATIFRPNGEELKSEIMERYNIETNEAKVQGNSVTLSGSLYGFHGNNSIYYGFYYSGDKVFNNATKIQADNKNEGGDFSVPTRLTPGTYYYKAYTTFNGKEYFGEVQTFKIVGVITGEATYKEGNITMGGSFNPEIENLSQYGICYSINNPAPALSDHILTAKVHDEGDFYVTLPDAQHDAIYYYRAYMIVGGETYYGDVRTVSTKETGGEQQNNIVGTWEPIFCQVKSYVPEDSEKFYEIPGWNWGVITFHPDSTYTFVSNQRWKLLPNNKLWLENIYGDGDDGIFTITELTSSTLSLQLIAPGLYKMDVIFNKMK